MFRETLKLQLKVEVVFFLSLHVLREGVFLRARLFIITFCKKNTKKTELQNNKTQATKFSQNLVNTSCVVRGK